MEETESTVVPIQDQAVMKREKTNKMQQSDVYYYFCLNMFWASLCPSSGEQRPCYCIWCIVLVLLDVVGGGCGVLSCRM